VQSQEGQNSIAQQSLPPLQVVFAQLVQPSGVIDEAQSPPEAVAHSRENHFSSEL